MASENSIKLKLIGKNVRVFALLDIIFCKARLFNYTFQKILKEKLYFGAAIKQEEEFVTRYAKMDYKQGFEMLINRASKTTYFLNFSNSFV
mmetsp:Transcript_26265/g.39761  ORF Transcript_26265/g.39761 Transcript_26265/m.39761 type:complete len:91 (+) Transcript_26265:1601-1873(+)